MADKTTWDTRRIDKPFDPVDATAGWTVLSNDTTGLATNARCVQGTNGLLFNKVDGTDNKTYAGIYKTLTKTRDMTWVSPLDEFVWYVYCAAYTNVTSAFLRIGTSGAHYVEYQMSVEDLQDGRFTCCHAPRYDFASMTGNGVDWNDVTYYAIGLNFSAETDALANIVVSEISVRPSAGQDADVPGTTVAADIAKVSASNPTLTAGTSSPLSISTTGELRAFLSSAEAVPDAAAPTRAVQVGAVANAAAPTPDENDLGALSMTLASELRTRLDLAQGATGASVPAQAVQLGGYAHTAVPAAVTAGQLVALLTDLYGRLKLASHDDSSGSDAVSVVGAIPKARLVTTLTQLTAAGSTEWVDITGLSKVTFGITIASINDSVTVRVEGSNDKSQVWNLNDDGVDTVYTADDDYVLEKYGVSCKYVRLTMVGESGGADVTVDSLLTALE